MRAGIAGAGLLGRLLAWRLIQKGWEVTLFDKNDPSGQGSAAYAAGGMLSLIAEQETAEPLIYRLGQKSLHYWKRWLPELHQNVFFQENGSILLAHTKDLAELDRTANRLRRRVGFAKVNLLNQKSIQELEPELHFQQAYFLRDEAQIDARALLEALKKELIQQEVTWYGQTLVTNISPGFIKVENKKFEFDWVFDCRGVGAQADLSDLRAVRGELIYLHASEVNLSHVIRFIHPRYRLYVIPRPNQIYLIGATEIENLDESPISVRSCLELLSAAYSIHKGFAEARIIETITAVRPAFPNNLPRLYYCSGLIAINGLYRHGFLMAPVLVDEAIHLVDQGTERSSYSDLVQEVQND